MKLDALDHPKTITLASILNICLPQAIGHLELLWSFVGQKTPQGDIGKWQNSVIAHAAQWTGDPDVFVSALIKVNYLDENQEHRLLIHDWNEHMPNWVRSKLSKLKLEPIKPKSLLSGNLSDHLIGQYKGREEKSNEDLKRDKVESRFDQFYSAYPKHVKRKTAEGIWKRKKLDSKIDIILEDISKRTQFDDRWRNGYIPDPTTYLNQERWNDEITKPRQQKSGKYNIWDDLNKDDGVVSVQDGGDIPG